MVVWPLVMTFSWVLVSGLVRVSTRIFVTSPRFGTDGKWYLRTRQGKSSISEKKIGFQSISAMRLIATEQASMPLKSET